MYVTAINVYLLNQIDIFLFPSVLLPTACSGNICRNSTARSVETVAIGVGELLKGTSKSGDISMECVALVSPIQRTSTK